MDTEERIWQRLRAAGFNEHAAAGIIGNLTAESALRADNLQDSYNRSIGLTDSEYTAAVDNGTYADFPGDSAGYGLAQWTFPTRKARLLAFAASGGKSIGDLDMQIDFLVKELREDYPGVYRRLLAAENVREASDAVLLEYERPADCSYSAQCFRAGLGEAVYGRLSGRESGAEDSGAACETQDAGAELIISLPLLALGANGEAVRAMQCLLKCRGYSVGWAGADGDFGQGTLGGLQAFQQVKGLEADGVCGTETWTRLLKG